MPSVIWFRRDLRLRDHPALLAACGAADDGVVPLFVLDPTLWDRSGPARLAWLAASLRSLDESLGGRLTLRRGNPVDVVPAVARECGAASVHVSADFGPYGAERDAEIPADREERHPARLAVATHVRRKFGSFGVIRRGPEPGDDDEKHADRVGGGDRGERHSRAGQKDACRQEPHGAAPVGPVAEERLHERRRGCRGEDQATRLEVAQLEA